MPLKGITGEPEKYPKNEAHWDSLARALKTKLSWQLKPTKIDQNLDNKMCKYLLK